MKLHELIDFVKPFAMPSSEKSSERFIASKSQTSMKEQVNQSGYQVLNSSSDIEIKVLNEQWAALVYVAKMDQMPHLSVIEDMAKEYGQFLKVYLYVVDDLTVASADLVREFKSSELPQFRFYPNQKTGS